jgi:hypothetical protein
MGQPTIPSTGSPCTNSRGYSTSAESANFNQSGKLVQSRGRLPFSEMAHFPRGKSHGNSRPNAYEIRGAITAIFLRKKDGGIVETIIDTDKLDLVLGYGMSWHAWWSGRRWYATSNVSRPVRGRVYLHRFLTNAPDGLPVDHVDHDGLNNRMGNLRVVETPINALNRNPAKVLNKNGYRGVFWYKPTSKWMGRFHFHGKYHHVGYFPTKEEAGAAVEKAITEILDSVSQKSS